MATRCMAAFPKADIQEVGIGVVLDGRLWPKADIERYENFPENEV